MTKRRKIEGIPLEVAIEAARGAPNNLWASLASLLKREACRRVMFTAVERGAGTTVVAAQSVLGLVKNTRRSACLLEANLANPGLASYLGVRPSPGLASLLSGAEPRAKVTVDVPGTLGFAVVPAGESRATVPGEFATKEVGDELRKLLEGYDHSFIDAPPILTHPESRQLLELVDGVIVVVRARSTLKNGLRDLERILDDLGVPLYGVIVNRYRSDMPFGLD